MFVFPPELAEDARSISTNCPKEKIPTEQQYITVTPEVYEEVVAPLDLLKMTKRLMMCSSCGNLRLID